MGKHLLWDPVEDNIVKEIDDASTTVADYTTEPYLYGDLISQHRDGQSSFYHYDGQGNATSLTGLAAIVVDSYAYSAFGVVAVQSGSTVNPFMFGGRRGYYRDTEREDYEVRRRTLSSIGRWRCSDPVPFADGPNGYTYARNRPLRFLDPAGTKCIVCKWIRRLSGDGVDASDAGLMDPIHRKGIKSWDLQNAFYEDLGNVERQPPHRKFNRPVFPEIDHYSPFVIQADTIPAGASIVSTYSPYAIDALVCGDDCLVTVIETTDEWRYSGGKWERILTKDVTTPFSNYRPNTLAGGIISNCMTSMLNPLPEKGCDRMITFTDIPKLNHFPAQDEFHLRINRQWIYISDGAFEDEAHSAYNKLRWRETLWGGGPPWKAAFAFLNSTSRTIGDADECC